MKDTFNVMNALPSQTMKKISCSLALIVLILTGCSDTINGLSIAEPKVEEFHQQLKNAEYDRIYESTHEEFKKATTKEKFTQMLEAIRRKLGAVKNTQAVNWKVNTKNFRTYVMIVQETEFEKGKGTETFTFSVADDDARLIGYYINSMDMMIH